jgi:hypothetical protein
VVVDTGGWLTSRRVLLSPIAVRDTNWQHDRIAVNLTRDQVRDSPDWDTERPIARQRG